MSHPVRSPGSAGRSKPNSASNRSVRCARSRRLSADSAEASSRPDPAPSAGSRGPPGRRPRRAGSASVPSRSPIPAGQAAPQRRRGRNFPRCTRFSRELTPLPRPAARAPIRTQPRLPRGWIPPMTGGSLPPRPALGARPPHPGAAASRAERPGRAVAAAAPEPCPAQSQDVAAAFTIVDSGSSEAKHRSQSES